MITRELGNNESLFAEFVELAIKPFRQTGRTVHRVS